MDTVAGAVEYLRNPGRLKANGQPFYRVVHASDYAAA
jgi:hypothetical protein